MPKKIATKSLIAAALLGSGPVALAAPALAHGASSTAGGASAPTVVAHRRHARRHGRRSRHGRKASFDGISIATWFGPGLFGNHTACGQVLSRKLVGVANRTLPCGTLVRFSYKGRHVVVPVVDRGPYGPLGASWDLTEHAARMLRMTETEKVRSEVVGHVANSPLLGMPQPVGSQQEEQGAPAAEPVPTATGGIAAG